MTHLVSRLRALGLCALACGSQAALAQVATAQASVSAFSYTLIDLDPTDGITPGLTWLDTLSVSNAGYGVLNNPGSANPSFSTVFSDRQEAQGLGASTQVTGSQVTAATSATGSTASASIEAYGASFGASSAQGGHFTLTANTAVVFTAHYEGTVTGQIPADAYYPNGYFDWAYVDLYAGGQLTILADGYPIDFLCCSAYPSIRDGAPSSTASVSSDLTRTFSNATGVSATFGVVAIANVGGYTLPTMVPEPAAWAQMLVGLGLLGVARRRLRQA